MSDVNDGCSRAGGAVAMTFPASVVARVEREARRERTTAEKLFLVAVEKYLDAHEAVAQMPTRAEFKELAALIAAADAKDDWQDYVAWE